jgi:hypothetical protein
MGMINHTLRISDLELFRSEMTGHPLHRDAHKKIKG